MPINKQMEDKLIFADLSGTWIVLLLIHVIAGCSGKNELLGSSGKKQQAPSGNDGELIVRDGADSEAAPVEDGSGIEAADAPAMMAGAFLTCRLDASLPSYQSASTIGCRMEKVQRKIPLPDGHRAVFSLNDGNRQPLDFDQQTAPAESPWHWYLLVSKELRQMPDVLGYLDLGQGARFVRNGEAYPGRESAVKPPNVSPVPSPAAVPPPVPSGTEPAPAPAEPPAPEEAAPEAEPPPTENIVENRSVQLLRGTQAVYLGHEDGQPGSTGFNECRLFETVSEARRGRALTISFTTDHPGVYSWVFSDTCQKSDDYLVTITGDSGATVPLVAGNKGHTRLEAGNYTMVVRPGPAETGYGVIITRIELHSEGGLSSVSLLDVEDF